MTETGLTGLDVTPIVTVPCITGGMGRTTLALEVMKPLPPFASCAETKSSVQGKFVMTTISMTIRDAPVTVLELYLITTAEGVT